jgi:1-acyl-sn-glycerol-3-phosphate acyltransferase
MLIIVPFIMTQLMRSLLPRRLSYRAGNWLTSFFSRVMLRVLGVKVIVKGGVSKKKKGVILCSNHLSWLDPLIIQSVFPARFITSTDVAGDSLLGRITKLAGCQFVSRSAAGLKSELNELGNVLAEGVPLAFFPEATTGSGIGLLPFKPALFELSFVHEVPIQLFSVVYRSVNRSEINIMNREQVYYFGDVGFLEHLQRVLKLSVIEVELEMLDVLDPNCFENRKEMCKASYEIISSKIEDSFLRDDFSVSEKSNDYDVLQTS